MASRPELAICVVTGGRAEVSLVCAMNLLRLQNQLMRMPGGYSAEMHFVDTHDDALNRAWQRPGAEGVLVVESTVGLDPEFLAAALASGRSVVVASHPLPVIDWDRVKSMPAGEEPAHWGNVYNVRLRDGARPDAHGHVQAEAVTAMGAAWVRRDALAAIVARYPGVLARDGATAAFATEGVYDGVRRTAIERFLDLYAGEVWVDVQRQASCTGPAEFGGAVAERAILR